jgi:hypothetical protein
MFFPDKARAFSEARRVLRRASAGGRLNVAFAESAGFGSELPRWRTLAEDELRDLVRQQEARYGE